LPDLLDLHFIFSTRPAHQSYVPSAVHVARATTPPRLTIWGAAVEVLLPASAAAEASPLLDPAAPIQRRRRVTASTRARARLASRQTGTRTAISRQEPTRAAPPWAPALWRAARMWPRCHQSRNERDHDSRSVQPCGLTVHQRSDAPAGGNVGLQTSSALRSAVWLTHSTVALNVGSMAHSAPGRQSSFRSDVSNSFPSYSTAGSQNPWHSEL